MSRLKKGSAQNGVIMWTGLIIAALITVNWTVSHIKPHHIGMEKINADVEAVQGKINAACNSMLYRTRYNPVIEEGQLIISNNTTCINSTVSLCRLSLCSTGIDATIDLRDITYVVIEKNETSFNVYGQ
jgi:hypothetical protein